MSFEPSTVDICDEVINFAHEQGHTKASKNTINWKGLRTEPASVKFRTLSKTIKSKIVETPRETDSVFKNLSVSISHTKGQVSSVIHANELCKTGASTNNTTKNHGLECQQNCILNKADRPIACNIAMNSTLPNKAETFVQFANTIICSRQNTSNRNLKLNNYHRSRPRPTMKNDFLTKISLSPKFNIKLSPETTSRRRIHPQAKKLHQLKANLLLESEILVEIIEHKEEEKGEFEVDYYLWGSVEIVVWGKPYTLVITDILDTKHNALFIR